MAQLKPREILERAKEFLHCAEDAMENDHYNACAICSYAALLWAARAALAHEGFDQVKWEHGELHAAFENELIKHRGRFPKNFGARLTNAYYLRNEAQYFPTSPSVKRIRRIVGHAKELIHKVDEAIKK